MRKREKVQHLMSEVRRHLDADRYWSTAHADHRRLQRSILLPDLLYVLRHGYHERAKDRYDEGYSAWNYAVRGKTVDDRELRVIVSFDENGMLIITAFGLRE